MWAVWLEAMGLGLIGGLMGLPLGPGWCKSPSARSEHPVRNVPAAGGIETYSWTLWLSGLAVGVLASVLAATIPAARRPAVDRWRPCEESRNRRSPMRAAAGGGGGVAGAGACSRWHAAIEIRR